MSATGALLEGAVIPEGGALVQLIRGGLIVHGLVAWSAGDRCGLKFSDRVDVQHWRAVSSNTEQQRVDVVIRLVQAGAVPLPVAPLAESSSCGGMRAGGTSLAGDLRRVSELLDQLGEELAMDPHVIMEHGVALQSLDIATQVLAAVQEMFGEGSTPGVDPAKLQALRRSADQAFQASKVL